MKNILFSHTRSGTNLVMGSIYCLTRKPLAWLRDFREYRMIDDALKLDLISKDPVLYFSHKCSELINRMKDQDTMVYLLRNPHELLIREIPDLCAETVQLPKSKIELTRFITLLQTYELNKYKKKIIYYEDLISDTESIILDIMKFINETPVFLDDYRVNKEMYFQKIRDIYKVRHQQGGLSFKDGKPQAIHYSKNADPDLLIAIDKELKNMAPELYRKYLTRYEWKTSVS